MPMPQNKNVEIFPAGFYAQAKRVGVCPECGGEGVFLSQDGSFRTFAKICPCRMENQRINLYNSCCLPSHFFEATLDNFQLTRLHEIKKAVEAAKEKVKEFREGKVKKGLLFYGPPGTGKTRLICALLRSLMLELGVSCRFIEFAEFLNQIKRGYDAGEYEGELLAPLLKVEVLAIDELGKGRKTDWESAILDQIISKRYFTRKVTFFTTNYALEGSFKKKNNKESEVAEKESFLHLKDRIDLRVYSRICEMCDFVGMDAADFRVHPMQVVSF